MHHTFLFCTFLCRFCTTGTWKCLISRIMENLNKQRRNFISPSELGYGPLNSTSGGFTHIWQSKWVGIIPIKTLKNANSVSKRRSRSRRVVGSWIPYSSLKQQQLKTPRREKVLNQYKSFKETLKKSLRNLISHHTHCFVGSKLEDVRMNWLKNWVILTTGRHFHIWYQKHGCYSSRMSPHAPHLSSSVGIP